MNLRRWLREPLLHFIGAGALMFLLAGWAGSPVQDERTIHVSRAALLAHMQGQARVYEEGSFARWLEAMPAGERRQLIHEVALQEALYREGQAIGLVQADPLIRLRIVQQMRLLIMDESAADIRVDDAEVAAYYRSHAADYRQPATVSFTHVFFSAAAHGAQAEDLARAELARLRARGVTDAAAARYGDRFLYQLNYVDSDLRLVASHFGEPLAQRVFALAPAGGWSDPLQSEHGWHLVWLRERTAETLPVLAEIGDRVRADALSARRERLAGAALERLLARYRIEVAPGVDP